MTLPIRFCLLLIPLWLAWCASPAFAQVQDFGGWLGLNVEKKLTTKAAINLNLESRFAQNLSVVDNYFLNLGGSYELTSFLRISGHYRLSRKRDLELFYRNRHRYNIDAALKHKISEWGLNYRLRFQSQYSSIHSSEFGSIPANDLRHKFEVNYSFQKPYEPRLWTELFYGFAPQGMSLQRIRYGAGIERRLNKHQSVDVAFLVQQNRNQNNPEVDFIVAVSYQFVF